MNNKNVLNKLVINKNYAMKVINIPCTLVPGDGIGPELINSVLQIFHAIHVPVIFETVSHDKQDGLEKIMSSIKKNRIALIGTIGYIGSKDIGYSNIDLRRKLDLFANVVHSKTYPGIKTRHKEVDIHIIREQTEGEYSLLEHESAKGVVECLKITTEFKTKRLAKFAFDFAEQHNRKKVTAVHKANIIKLGDGLFLECCRQISTLYPKIQFTNLIVDNATMQLVSKPEQFEIIIVPNLYGSILDNICSGITGGAGVTPGASYSPYVAIFQPGARHTFVDAKGKNIANPLAMILSAVNLLEHVNLKQHAKIIKTAIKSVLNDRKVLTHDIGGKATTQEFTAEIINKCK